ncbi:phage tail tape measure protein [Alteriqipengyuania lutimaris]|nr:phage tail tape measure protein [Alteriqipengyuania lutimaris]MBB3034059.1 phage-related minor tail protein [Alteriqipengyuania lutimaris]
MALGEEIARLAVSLSMDSSEFATGSTKVQRDLGRLQASFQALGDKWMQTGKRLTIGVTTPIAAFGLLSAKAASDAQELDSAFTATFDNLSGEMRDWARETGDAMGRSTQAMQQMANTFGIFFNQAAPTRKEAAEMSKTFTVLAQDLSSFYNVSGDEALQKLRSGLSGESEPLRDFGVFLTEATVKAKAMEMGLTGLGDELTEQEKILARYQLILESTRDAQGDVARTSGGAANQWRSFTEALDELRVVIGERLLPLLTPMVKGMTNLVNGFNNLPGGVQTAIVAVGAMMAAIGPMMLIMGTLAATLLPLFAAKFGPIGIAISAFINPLGTAISFLAQFAVQLAGMTALKTVGALLLRFAGPVGLIASLGLLIYKNWDRISEVFATFAARAKEAIGPPLERLVATISAAFNDLWQGPLGDGIRMAMGVVEKFGGIVGSVLGEALIRVLSAALELVTYVFEQMGTAIDTINALLNGDFRGAWESAKGFVTNAVNAVLNIIEALAPGSIAAMQKLYTGVKTWLMDKLGGVLNWVQEKVAAVENSFAWLYDRVVGNSWVPDMVASIGSEMARLDSLMVDPARKATQSVDDAMREMAGNTRALLARLFPEIEKARAMADDLATIDASQLSDRQKSEARRRLRNEYYGFDDKIALRTKVEELPDILTIPDLTREAADKTRVQAVRIADSFKDMAEKTVGSLRGMADAIKSGGFLGIFESALNLFLQLGSTGLFGKTLATNINRVPAYASGTSFHPGGLALVGERGPELVSMPRGSQVFTNRESRAMGRSSRVEIVPSPYFDVRVDGRAAQVAAPMASLAASAGSAGAQMSFARSRKRRMS